jgi:hypothetical protein
VGDRQELDIGSVCLDTKELQYEVVGDDNDSLTVSNFLVAVLDMIDVPGSVINVGGVGFEFVGEGTERQKGCSESF